METSELAGAALDWAVAKCEGFDYFNHQSFARVTTSAHSWTPSTNWAQGGPIIERECIMLDHDRGFDSKQPWRASLSIDPYNKTDGPTPLIAAMRCYVASKLGDEIEVPKELTI